MTIVTINIKGGDKKTEWTITMDACKLVTVLVWMGLLFAGSQSQRVPECHQIGFDNCLKRNFFAIGRREDVSMLVTTETGFDQLCR